MRRKRVRDCLLCAAAAAVLLPGGGLCADDGDGEHADDYYVNVEKPRPPLSLLDGGDRDTTAELPPRPPLAEDSSGGGAVGTLSDFWEDDERVGFWGEDGDSNEEAGEYYANNNYYEANLDEESGLFTTISGEHGGHRHHHVRRTQLADAGGKPSPSSPRDCVGFPTGFSQTVYLILYDMHNVIDTDEEINALRRMFRDVMNACRANDECLQVEQVDMKAQELQEYLGNSRTNTNAGQRKKRNGRWRALLAEDEDYGRGPEEDDADAAVARAMNRTSTSGAAAEEWMRRERELYHRRAEEGDIGFDETVDIDGDRERRDLQRRGGGGGLHPRRLMTKLYAGGYGYCRRNPVCRSKYPLTQTSGRMLREEDSGGGGDGEGEGFDEEESPPSDQQRDRPHRQRQLLGSCAARMLNRLVNSKYEAFQCLTLVEIYGSDPRCF